MGATRRLLIVARHFPPSGGAPALRVTKLAKFLPEFGWHAEIVTVPEDHAWSEDVSLYDDVPSNVAVHRVARWLSRSVPPARLAARAVREMRPSTLQRIAGAALVPDSGLLWALPALGAVRLLLPRADALLTTAPPFSTHLVGLFVSPRIPWVADFRDNWTTNPDYRGTGPVRLFNRVLERAVLRRATIVSAVSRAAAAELEAVQPGTAHKTVVAINGFDVDDLPGPGERPRKFRLTYAGSMRGSRDPRPLISALCEAADADAQFATDVELELLGTIPESSVAGARAALGEKRVRVHGFVPHRQALAASARAAVLVALSSSAEAGAAALTSKLIEYLALARPILFLAPRGPGRDLVQTLGAGEVADPANVQQIRGAIGRLYADWRRGMERVASRSALDAYTRRETARVIAEALDARLADRRVAV